MDSEYCLDCKKSTEVVTVETVCLECGLVLSDRYIDERSEWRVFVDDSGDGGDPSRVGWSANPLLGNAPLDTGISKARARGGGTTVVPLSTKLARNAQSCLTRG